MNYYRQGPFRPGGPAGQIGVPTLTPYVRAIMMACGAVWVAQLVGAGTGFLLEPIFGVVPARVIRGWLWQPVTSMFLHSTRDIMHIVINMLMLWMFGTELERHWGGRSFLRYYLVCGVGGGIFAAVMGYLPWGSPISVTLGASGAIFGLLAAYGMEFAERRILFMLIFPMKARTMAILMFVVTFFYTFNSSGSGVSHVSHLGGAVVGFLFLKRAWRFGEFYRELRWQVRRRKFKVMDGQDDSDRWVN